MRNIVKSAFLTFVGILWVTVVNSSERVTVVTPYLAQPGTQMYLEGFKAKAQSNGWDLNIIDTKGNLISTLIGKQEEQTIRDSIDNLNGVFRSNEAIVNSDFSQIRVNKNHQAAPRSHG